ncbi:MAG: energy transducer TonB, partial [bacterium]|nr:energy transducer TonB [bacterium]
FFIVSAFFLILVSAWAEQPNHLIKPTESSYQFDHPPAFVDSVSPVYPAIARKAQIEGTIVVKAIVGARGQLTDTELITRINPMLNKAALDALKESSFSPATKDGIAVPGFFTVSYPFDLDRWFRDHLRKEKPSIDWRPPLISEVGKLVKNRGNAASCVFTYENIRVYGDVSVDIFDNVLEQVRPHLSDGEVVISINHHLAYKELGEMDFMGVSDLDVTTCTEKNSLDDCSRGNIFTFINEDGIYMLEFQKGSRKVWMH